MNRLLRSIATSVSTPQSHTAALSLTVIFTTVPGTLAALKQGAHLAHQLGAKIRVLVPSVVPFPLDLDKPRIDPLFGLRRFRTVCENGRIETSIDIRLCRNARRCIEEGLPPHSLILMGRPKTWWPLNTESRLAKSLKKAGHEVIVVEHDRQ